MTQQWEAVIGLEIHIQLSTQSKLFSGSSTAYGADPNTQASAIDIGLPGVLPVVNEEAVRLAILFGLSINAEINPHSVFSRKNYFYPDLPKGYQITQHKHPIIKNGSLTIDLPDQNPREIHIARAHLEEDAGKSTHEGLKGFSGIDLNRAGVPLLEIVTAPNLYSADEAVDFLKRLHNLVRYLGICDGNMQEGSFRCDANVSVKPKGSHTLGERTETKNLNSFRFIGRAINHEIARQIDLLESGGKVRLETRLYNPDKNETRAMRDKEEEHSYRYFPDPDLLPLILDETRIDNVKRDLPELPWDQQARFIRDYGLTKATAVLLTSDIVLARYFEKTTTLTNASPISVAKWVTGQLLAGINKMGGDLAQEAFPIKETSLAKLLDLIEDKTISGKIAKTVFDRMWEGELEGDPDAIIQANNLQQITDTHAIEKTIDDILANNPKQLADYKKGKEKLFGYFIGQIMKETKGKANPSQVNDLLKKKLQSAHPDVSD